MKTAKILSVIISFALLSFTALTLADQHLCPSGKGIKAAIRDKSLVHFEGDPYDSNSNLEYFGFFDTNETWFFTYSVMDAKNAADAWKRFQWWIDMIPNTPQYAQNFPYYWLCEYSIGISDLQLGYWVRAYLKSP